MLKATPKSEKELKLLENCNVVVSTVAAIQGMPKNLLKRLAGMFGAAFFDEAHHLPAYSWDRIHDAFAEKPVLQFTATPFRLDGQRIPGRMTYNFPFRAAQAEGYFRKIQFLTTTRPEERRKRFERPSEGLMLQPGMEVAHPCLRHFEPCVRIRTG